MASTFVLGLTEFKKAPDQEKLQRFGAIFKAYQGEIDAITKREKATSQAFLNVYNALGQAPDPAKLLQVAVVGRSRTYWQYDLAWMRRINRRPWSM